MVRIGRVGGRSSGLRAASAWAALVLTLAAASARAETAAACRPDQIAVPPGSTITFEGDSLTYGLDTTETDGLPPINRYGAKRSRVPFPEEVGRLLQGRIEVVNHGFPGDRTTDGLKRWTAEPTTALTVILFGTNDFGNYGKLAGGPLDPEAFRRGLAELVDRRLSQGGRVLLLTPPPVGHAAPNLGLEPYRAVVREVAQARGIAVLDTGAAMAEVTPAWTDRLHLSRQANAAIAAAVAQRICLSP